MAEYRRKLIEVALPLEAINRESAVEKSPRMGHPSTLHLWWARRPLAACRAVLFASLVDDPSSNPEKFPSEEAQEQERQRLFRIIEDLVKWENSDNEAVLNAARSEILKSTNGHPPPVLDPFCGGGSIPLEAQRLGLEAHASDLNPVAVLITKALIEIPPKFAGRPPVNPEARKKLDHTKAWIGAEGLAEDIRYYGKWMRDEAEKRVGQLYPKVKLPKEHGGEAAVIAWLWARTVKCPNPACGAGMPLARSFWLSTKSGKKTWIKPVVDKSHNTVRFEVNTGKGAPPDPPKIGRGAKFRCLVCEQPADDQYIKDEGSAKRMGAQLMAIVAEGPRGRSYLDPAMDHEVVAKACSPRWSPEEELPYEPRAIWCTLYGLKTYRDLFTLRQLVTLTTFTGLVGEIRDRVLTDAHNACCADDNRSLNEDGVAATAYADSIAMYVGMGVSRLVNRSSTLCFWDTGGEKIQQVFARQGMPMTWDFAEGNPFSDSSGNFMGQIDYLAAVIENSPCESGPGFARQLDATSAIDDVRQPFVFTDPPYYDNIGYADLSDFFYVWLRRSLGRTFPNLFSTVLTPKAPELVASPYRFAGDKEKARDFFEKGFGRAFGRLRNLQHQDYPLALFYAFRQAETAEPENDEVNEDSTVASTGWETMLEGLLRAGLSVNGTWPMRTELVVALKKRVGALASSILLSCRPRKGDAPLATRREFISSLKRELPIALRNLQRGSIAPVDMAQAAIGPGMAVFSRYSKVVEADGSPMTVRTALALINQTLDEVLAEQESEFDADTRWALAWFEQYAFNEGPFGVAETLSKAKNTSVQGMVDAGILSAKAGKVRLLGRKDLAEDWDPASERRLTIWEVAHYLIRLLEEEGEGAAALLFRQVGALGETARDLAYRLYGICERKKWAQEALPYNSLVVAWPEITRLSRSERPKEEQAKLGL